MLVSLGIRNFVLIEDASLEFGPGLTALTGETGAGKTLLTQALGLLLGERAADGLVGGAGEEAFLQAVFDLGEREARSVPSDLAELAGVEAGELIASRRLHQSGRNRCYLNGAAVSLTALGEALGGLVAFSGQHEHRRLLEPGYQRLGPGCVRRRGPGSAGRRLPRRVDGGSGSGSAPGEGSDGAGGAPEGSRTAPLPGAGACARRD